MERRKFVIGLGSLAAGGAAATGTGAFSAAQITGRDADIEVSGDAGSLVALVPGQSSKFSSDRSVTPTVGDNRVRQEDGELLIDFTDSAGGSGINYNSTYQVGAVGWANSSFSEAPNALDVEKSDVLYGDSANPSEPVIQEDPAFAVINQTDTEIKINLAYNDVTTPANGDAALLAEPGVPGDDNSTTSGNEQGEVELGASIGAGVGGLNATLPSGKGISFSVLAVMGDPETTSNGTVDSNDDWEGSIKLTAEEATNF